jgi:hypothetical protein
MDFVILLGYALYIVVFAFGLSLARAGKDN